MRRVCFKSLLLACSGLLASAALSQAMIIDFPCSKNLVDGRVLVDGTEWDAKMRQLGYVIPDGAYVPYEVLKFSQQKVHDDTWSDGLCQMKLLPIEK